MNPSIWRIEIESFKSGIQRDSLPPFNKHMAGLTPQERQQKFADLNWATFADNPVGVAKVFFDSFIVAVNPSEYISRLRLGWFVGLDQIFDAGFVETVINPRVWQQILPDMPSKSTLSLVYFNHSGILIWLYFVLALVAPLGIWFVQRRYRNLFALWSVVTSVYVWSTLIFSPDLVPRYYCVLPPLLLALFMLLLDGFLYGPARTKWQPRGRSPMPALIAALFAWNFGSRIVPVPVEIGAAGA